MYGDGNNVECASNRQTRDGRRCSSSVRPGEQQAASSVWAGGQGLHPYERVGSRCGHLDECHIQALVSP
jgi:hypothetical protein